MPPDSGHRDVSGGGDTGVKERVVYLARSYRRSDLIARDSNRRIFERRQQQLERVIRALVEGTGRDREIAPT